MAFFKGIATPTPPRARRGSGSAAPRWRG